MRGDMHADAARAFQARPSILVNETLSMLVAAIQLRLFAFRLHMPSRQQGAAVDFFHQAEGCARRPMRAGRSLK